MYRGLTGNGGGEGPGQYWVRLVKVMNEEQYMYVEPVGTLSWQSREHSIIRISEKYIDAMPSVS